MKRLFGVVTAHLEDLDLPEQHSLFYEEIRRLYEKFVELKVDQLYADLQNVLQQISGYIVEGGIEDPLQSDEEYCIPPELSGLQYLPLSFK